MDFLRSEFSNIQIELILYQTLNKLWIYFLFDMKNHIYTLNQGDNIYQIMI